MQLSEAAAAERRERQRQYRAANREHIRATARAWEAKNKDRRKEYNRRYYEKLAAVEKGGNNND